MTRLFLPLTPPAGGCGAFQNVHTPDAMLATIGYVNASNASDVHVFGTRPT